MLQNHFHVILSDLYMDAPGRPWTPLDAPGRPWTPLYAPVSKYYFFKCSQNFHPPLPKSTAKSFSSHFKRFVPGRPCTPLYAPVRPCTPLYAPVRPVSKHDLLEEPCAGACHIIFGEFRYLSMHRPVHNHLPIVIKYTINI